MLRWNAPPGGRPLPREGAYRPQQPADGPRRPLTDYLPTASSARSNTRSRALCSRPNHGGAATRLVLAHTPTRPHARPPRAKRSSQEPPLPTMLSSTIPRPARSRQRGRGRERPNVPLGAGAGRAAVSAGGPFGNQPLRDGGGATFGGLYGSSGGEPAGAVRDVCLHRTIGPSSGPDGASYNYERRAVLRCSPMVIMLMASAAPITPHAVQKSGLSCRGGGGGGGCIIVASRCMVSLSCLYRSTASFIWAFISASSGFCGLALYEGGGLGAGLAPLYMPPLYPCMLGMLYPCGGWGGGRES
mmetsp:Transcript_2499/g.5185  ORF Transcript_2499/g.5185 Transcript_2499/m.5185 type:complete len:301 (-) Transcript_2499:31-933(-)